MQEYPQGNSWEISLPKISSILSSMTLIHFKNVFILEDAQSNHIISKF